MTHKRITLSLLIASLACAGAQAQNTASLSGVLLDPAGRPVEHASVSLKMTASSVTRTAATDSAGHFVFAQLPAASYELRAANEGFKTAVRTQIPIVAGQNARVDLHLELGERTEQIVVTETAAEIQNASEGAAGLVDEREVSALPLNGRSYDELLTLNPGVINYSYEKKQQYARHFELRCWEHVLRPREASAGKPVSGRWNRVYRLGRDQHDSGRHERPSARR